MMMVSLFVIGNSQNEMDNFTVNQVNQVNLVKVQIPVTVIGALYNTSLHNANKKRFSF